MFKANGSGENGRRQTADGKHPRSRVLLVACSCIKAVASGQWGKRQTADGKHPRRGVLLVACSLKLAAVLRQ